MLWSPVKGVSRAATMERVAALACRETRQWTCRWENGSTATVQLRDGAWTLWGHSYRLRDETPISFVWSDGTVQTVEEWDGHTITWTTTNAAYPRIYWDAVAAPPSGSRAPSRTTQALRAPRPDLCACWIPCCPCICMPSLDGFLKPRMLSWQDEWPTPTPYPVLRERLDALSQERSGLHPGVESIEIESLLFNFAFHLDLGQPEDLDRRGLLADAAEAGRRRRQARLRAGKVLEELPGGRQGEAVPVHRHRIHRAA